MSAPARFPNGINTTPGMLNATGALRNNHPLYMYPAPCPLRLFEVDEDFATYRVVDWTLTAVGTGTSALVDGAGGILRLLTTAAANDSVNIQHTSSDLIFTSGNQFWYTTRLTPQLASTPGYYFGLMNSGATAPGAATNGVYFYCAPGSANVALVSKVGGVAVTIAAIGTLADAVASKWSFYYDGKSTLYYYKDGVLLASTDTTSTPLPTVTLAQQFYTINGAAVTNYLDIDYYLASCELTR